MWILCFSCVTDTVLYFYMPLLGVKRPTLCQTLKCYVSQIMKRGASCQMVGGKYSAQLHKKHKCRSEWLYCFNKYQFTTRVHMVLQTKFIVYLTTRTLVWTERGLFPHSPVVVFFHLPTGFCSSRTSINTKDPACGIGWCGGTRPTPEVLRATGKECAWEGETTENAEQGRRQEEIWTMSKMEESRSHVSMWVCDNSSRKMCPEISSGYHVGALLLRRWSLCDRDAKPASHVLSVSASSHTL